MNIEVGDMVIVPKFGSKTFKTVDRIIYDPVIDRTAEQNMTILLKPYGQCKYRDVSVIRKPRPGCKEARDIVAMLAMIYRNNVIKDWKKKKLKHGKSTLKLAYKSWTVRGQGSYTTAKAMLRTTYEK